MKKCAVINDLSGFGKCSLCVALPVISVMGVEAHPLPTVVLSNQTGYDSFSAHSLSEVMPDFIQEWKKLDPHFDSIMTGFFNDECQLDSAVDFIDCFKKDDTILIVDPVMADNGRLYDGVSDEMCKKIKELCSKADIITPNLSELAILADEPPSTELDDIIRYGKKLIHNGMKSIVATGYKKDGMISNIIFENDDVSIVSAKELGGYYSGTGDILTSIITASVTKGKSLYASTKLATAFIEKVIKNTDAENHNDGIDFERYLGGLYDEK